MTSILSVGSSPFTYTAGSAQVVIYVSGGVVTHIIRNGIDITEEAGGTVVLPAGESVEFQFTDAPTLILDAPDVTVTPTTGIPALQAQRDEIIERIGILRTTKGDRSVEFTNAKDALALIDAEISKAQSKSGNVRTIFSSVASFRND